MFIIGNNKVPRRILIVDDEYDVNSAIAKALEQYGFKVDSYEYPLIALDSFKPQFYDLVILGKPIGNEELINRINEIIDDDKPMGSKRPSIRRSYNSI